MKKVLLVIIAVGTLVGCTVQTQKVKVDNGKLEVVDGHNARNSLDYKGTYEGTILDNTNSVIKLTITLTDKDYVMELTSLKEKAETVSRKGKYRWDDSGNIIILDEKVLSAKYFVGEGQLIQLDSDGKKRAEGDVNNYVLRKQWKP